MHTMVGGTRKKSNRLNSQATLNFVDDNKLHFCECCVVGYLSKQLRGPSADNSQHRELNSSICDQRWMTGTRPEEMIVAWTDKVT